MRLINTDTLFNSKETDTISRQACEDAVSREDAIRWVKTECNPYGKPTLDFESGKKVIEYLKHMPPVTLKRKRGKWISGAENFNTNCSHECSWCGALIDMYHGGADDYFFCPNCGADMRGEKI